MKNKIMPQLVTAMSVLLCLSCVSSVELKIDDKIDDIKANESSIAVLSGLNSELNLSMAILITENLKKNSTLKVMPQSDISRALSCYPTRIHGPWNFAYDEIDENYSMTDLEKVQQIQKKLGVDYMYIIWMPSTSSTNEGVEYVEGIAQIFKFPGCTSIGGGKISLTKYKEDMMDWGVGTMIKSKEQLLEKYGEKIALQIAKEMNAVKKPNDAKK
jgi:hypothetical protein